MHTKDIKLHSCMGEGSRRNVSKPKQFNKVKSKKGLKITSTISFDIVLGLPLGSLFLLLWSSYKEKKSV